MATELNPYLIITPILTFVFGVILERFKNRSITLEKSLNIQRIAFSNEAEIGNIQVQFDGTPISNLYTVRIEIINNSSKAVKDFFVDLSVGQNFYIYRNTGYIIQRELSKTLFLADKYNERYDFVNAHYDDEDKPQNFDNELDYVIRHKKYHVPILNKKCKIIIDLVVDGPIGLDTVHVGIFEENVDLIFKADQDEYKQNRMTAIHILATIAYIVTAFFIIKYATSVKESVYAMLINSLVCYLAAWAVYYLYKFIRGFFSN